MDVSIKNLTAEILTLLRSEISDVGKFEFYPKDVTVYTNLNSGRVILVRYAGSRSIKEVKGNTVGLNRVYQIQIYLTEKNLQATNQEETEMYDIIDKIISTLQGFQIPGFKKMVHVNDEFVDELNKVWMHGINFQIERVRI